MQRIDLFGLTHKGLRAALYHTALQIQQTNFLSAEQTEATLNRVREVILLFTEQSKRQDRHVLPALQPFEPSVLCAFEEEHASVEKLGKELLDLADRVELANHETERMEAGQSLNDTFTAFTAAQLRHMANEEGIGNTILWRYYTDNELQTIHARAEAATEPWIRDFFEGWMLRGINDLEAANWMNTIQRQQSETAYRTLLQKCATEFTPVRLRSIQAIRERNHQPA